MRWINPLVPVFAVALVAATAPSADAQSDRSWLLELQGGAFVPLSPSTWTEAVKTSVGIGAAVGYQLAPRVYLIASGTWGLVTGKEEAAPDWDVFGYFISGAYDLTEGKSVSLLAQLGAGGSTYELNASVGESNTYFAVNGGMKALWHINPKVGLSLNALARASFAKKEDFGSTETGTEIIWNLPLTAGVFFRF